MNDKEALAFGLVVIVMIIVGLYVAFAAPCDAIDWMPTGEMPGRCLR